MRAAVLFALASALAFTLAPSALAAGYEVGERTAEATLGAARSASYDFPITVTADGSLYAKVLGTPGNAVFDGERSNGSWAVSFTLVHANGSRDALGSFHDATATALVPVHDGDALSFETTVNAPADAATGGASQKVYVALAFRSLAATGGTGSGASMDEARAFTLVVSVPPSFAGDGTTTPPPATAPTTTPGTPSATAPKPGTPPVGEIPTTATHAAAASTDASAGANAPPAREQATATPWLAIAALALGAVATGALVTIAVVAVLALRELRRAAHIVPLAPREIRVHAEEAPTAHVTSRPRKDS